MNDRAEVIRVAVVYKAVNLLNRLTLVRTRSVQRLLNQGKVLVIVVHLL